MALIDRNGVWYFRKQIGKRLYRESTGYPVGTKVSRENALRKAAEIEVAIRAGRHGYTKAAPTVKTYWEKTYEPTYTQQKRAGRLDRQMMAHALPHLGAIQIDAVTPSMAEAYLQMRRQATAANPRRKTVKGISEGTVQRERSFLRAFFERARKDGWLTVNPFAGIKAIPYDVRERLLTDDEQAELLSRLSPKYQRFVLFLLGTGLRLEECRGIVPARDLDLQLRRVTVTGKFGKTRTVPLPAELIPTIEAQVKEGWWTANQQRLRDVLTTACKGVEPSPAGTRPQWQRKAQAAIPPLSPHVFRHTFGWRWLKGGGDIYTLSKVLGHATVAVTERHYAHLLAEDIQVKADRVDLGLGLKTAAKVLPIRKRR
jgi:integrase